MNNLTLGGTDAINTADADGGYSQSSSIDSEQNVTLGGNLTLTADSSVTTGGVVVVSGPITGDYTLTFDNSVQPQGQLVIDSSNNQSATPNTPASSSSSSSSTGGSSASAPKAPDTGSSLSMAKFDLPLIGTALVAGGLYIASKKNTKLTIKQK